MSQPDSISRVAPSTSAPLTSKPRLAVLYHYMYPDDVVSARHFADFCASLNERGWQIEALPCHRGCRDERIRHPRFEDWKGVQIRRIWRPNFRQSSSLGRIFNALWMIGAWSLLALRPRARRPHIVIVGTDPILSVLVAGFVKKIHPEIRFAHWCHDLYPEAAIAGGLLKEQALFVRLLRNLLRRAYRHCDLIADLGSCMRARLDEYQPQARRETLVPWALQEPKCPQEAEPAVRTELFGAETKLGLLYSGNFGRAHTCAEFIALAELLADAPVRFCFSARGNQEHVLKQSIQAAKARINTTGFVPEAELNRHLSAADIHLVSLRAEWEGIVVPSKFFGSLAAGRPVLFAGSRHSSIAKIIEQHQVGWVLEAQNIPMLAAELRRLAEKPDELRDLQRHCHSVYHQNYSRSVTMDRWDHALRSLLAQENGGH